VTGFSWVVGFLMGFMLLPVSACGRERPTAAALPAPREGPDLDRAKEQIMAATNQFRKQEKRRELKASAELSKAAQAFAEFMAKTDKYGHEADGKKPAERVTAAGYSYCIVAENIAYQFSSGGFTTDELVKGFMDGWKESPPHRKNLLDPDLDDIGVGLAQSSTSGKYYAVQNFGRPKSKEITFKITNQTEDTIQYTVGDESFSIKPRYTITHHLCRPADLKVQQREDKAAAAAKDGVFRPDDGTHYVLRKDDAGKYQVEKK
jgi:uncharacterized protein YkwD